MVGSSHWSSALSPYYDLTAKIGKWEVEPGRIVDAWTHNGIVPGPTIKVDVGDKVRLVVHNELPMGTDVHVHGIEVPNSHTEHATEVDYAKLDKAMAAIGTEMTANRTITATKYQRVVRSSIVRTVVIVQGLVDRQASIENNYNTIANELNAYQGPRSLPSGADRRHCSRHTSVRWRTVVYSKIIVPFDGGDFSARSISVARNVARLMHAPLKIVSFALTASHGDDLKVAAREEAQAVTDVPVTWQVRTVDDIVDAISKELAEEPGALICMSSVGRPRSAPVLGSVAEGVLSETFGPVLLVGPHAQTHAFSSSGTMVVCTDGSSAGLGIVPIAAQWLITLPLEPWVINVRDPDGMRVSPELQNDVGTDSTYAWHVAHDLKRQIGRTVQHDVLHAASAARAIAAFAEEKKATMIAMSTHGATGLRRVALGSVTMAVVHRALCPVLVHRPPHLPNIK